MPRYVVDRFFGEISDEEMLAAASRSEQIQAGRYPEITWDHSHICVDDGTTAARSPASASTRRPTRR